MIDRRHFLSAGIAGASALAFGSVWSQASPNLGQPTLPEPGFRRIKVGALEVIALNDGITRRPLGEEFVTNAPLEQVKALLASQGLPTDYVDIPYTAFLVVSGRTKILIDAGFADNGPPTAGRVRTHLAAAGYQPQDIDHVLVSHFHPDHIAGLRTRDGALTYPRAKLHVPAPEFGFWMDDARMNAAPPAARGVFQAARRIFASVSKDQLHQFEPGQEILPGITASAAFGHTPGMCVFTARSEGQSFTYVADVTNIPALFARAPEWSIAFDMDPGMARQTRRRIFDAVVREKSVVGGFHFPFPAIGTMEVAGNGYQFKPVA